MIRRRVRAVVQLRDGFTGRVLAGSGTVCHLDGQPLRRPLWKENGYLVLEDLAPGSHRLTLSRPGYRPSEIQIQSGSVLCEKTVALQPAETYRFPPETARLTVQVEGEGAPAAGTEIWMGLAEGSLLKQAQTWDKEDGSTQVRLFSQIPEQLLPVPGRFLVADPQNPELTALRWLRHGVGELEQPLALPHSRGTAWVGVMPFVLTETGLEACFRQGGTVWLFWEGALTSTRVESGSQTFVWKWNGGQ